MIKKILFIVLTILPLGCAVQQPPLPVTSLTTEAALEMRKEKNYWIEVQVPQRKLVLAKGNHVIKVFPIAVGMPSYPTPVGKRSTNRVIWNPWWYPPKTSEWVTDPTPVPPRSKENPLGEIKMPLGNAYLIHGTKAVRSIGRWASHGCIRMLFEDIFSLSQLLLTEYSKTNAVEQMERANKEPSKQFHINLKEDVPVIITYELVKVHKGYVTISPDIYKQEKDMVSYVGRKISPYIKKDKEPSARKIKSVLRMFRGRVIHVPIENLIS